uniref:Uncharacterized protein n=1 Tax=Arundo donax TaxID=35708 RepID=A0A0A9EYE1_ARUDO
MDSISRIGWPAQRLLKRMNWLTSGWMLFFNHRLRSEEMYGSGICESSKEGTVTETSVQKTARITTASVVLHLENSVTLFNKFFAMCYYSNRK